MSKPKRVKAQVVDAGDGRTAEVVFFDNDTIALILPPGHGWSILSHFSGTSGTRIRLAPVGVPADAVADDEVGANT